jgi:dihydrodipicolinate synthase/N-acetylneuraminate lyase
MKKPAQLDSNPLQGVIVAAITPRRQSETSIDLGATLELADFLGRSGVNAIALLGSTGEFVHFALHDRSHMVGFAAKRSRVPLLVNVSYSTLDGAVELAHDAADAGVAGLLLMPPYYFRYSQDAIRRFYFDFAEQTRGELPTFLYNIPVFTNALEIETALGLLDSGQFAGIKDSSGSWDYFVRLRDHATNRPYTILVGDDRMFARARMDGANGAVSGCASAVPELLVSLEAAIAAGERDKVDRLDRRLNEFVDRIMRFPLPAGIKEAVRLRRMNAGAPAAPYGDLERAELEQFAKWFEPWLGVVLEECK